MSAIRINPGGTPISSSYVVSASVCLHALDFPTTASYAEWANFPTGSNGSPFVRTVVGSVVLINTPPAPPPTPPECPPEGEILQSNVCSGTDLVNVRADGVCGTYNEITCLDIELCGGSNQGCE